MKQQEAGQTVWLLYVGAMSKEEFYGDEDPPEVALVEVVSDPSLVMERHAREGVTWSDPDEYGYREAFIPNKFLMVEKWAVYFMCLMRAEIDGEIQEPKFWGFVKEFVGEVVRYGVIDEGDPAPNWGADATDDSAQEA